jgi:adenylyltransferase/sulfurtransferase
MTTLPYALKKIKLTPGKFSRYDEPSIRPYLENEGDHSHMSYTITVRELKTRQDNGDAIFLLDVREPHEYSMAKIEGSVLIPLGELPNSLNQLEKNSEIVAYCHKGMRSADAVGFLLQQGFSNVKNLIGGIESWSIEIDNSVPRY